MNQPVAGSRLKVAPSDANKKALMVLIACISVSSGCRDASSTGAHNQTGLKLGSSLFPNLDASQLAAPADWKSFDRRIQDAGLFARDQGISIEEARVIASSADAKGQVVAYLCPYCGTGMAKAIVHREMMLQRPVGHQRQTMQAKVVRCEERDVATERGLALAAPAGINCRVALKPFKTAFRMVFRPRRVKIISTHTRQLFPKKGPNYAHPLSALLSACRDRG